MILSKHTRESIYSLLENVSDPEIPVLSVVDLGIIRNVIVTGPETVEVVITPTYTGCPAMDTIEKEIKQLLEKHHITAKVKTVISPPWTTDWMSEAGKLKLEAYGIAPPAEATSDKSFITGRHKAVKCPHCKSFDTMVISQFGSTACKALYRCDTCLEVFDYFKCI